MRRPISVLLRTGASGSDVIADAGWSVRWIETDDINALNMACSHKQPLFVEA